MFFSEEKELNCEPHNHSSIKCSVLFVCDNDESWEEVMELREYINQLESDIAEKEDIEYRQFDPIRKYQIDYDKSICLKNTILKKTQQVCLGN